MFKLDFGSGYNPKSGYYTCDITGLPNIDFLFDNHTYTIIDIKRESVDLIRCRNVIHHIEELENLFSEFNRVLKCGGFVSIIEPTKENYVKNKILDIIWYRFLSPRYEIWFSNKYREYTAIFYKLGFTKVREIKLGRYKYIIFKKGDQK